SALRWSGLVVTVLVAILVLGGGWVIGSTSGTAWSLQLLTRLVPEVTVEGISGNWQRGVAIQRLSYAPPEGAAITVDGLRLGVGVQRGRRVTLEPLTARAVEI